jgi:hypothetical protein
MHHARGVSSRAAARSAVVVWMVLVSAACSERVAGGPQVPDPRGQGSLALYLSGEAANQLQPDGTLRLANAQTVTSRPQINEVQARELAAAYATTHLRGILPTLERDRGAPIDITGITVCPRVFYAESPTEELPSEMPAMYHRLYGPWWLATLCIPSGEAVIALAVSAYATELRVENGKLWYPERGGEEFRIAGIPPGEENQLPLSPEVAVRHAAKAANRRIAAIPRLILQSPPQSAYPQLARWQLSLDAEAEVRVSTKSGKVKVKDLFVGGQYRSKLKVKRASPEQPDGVDAQWLPEDAADQLREGLTPGWRTTRVARRNGVPITFDDVDSAGGL